MTSVATAAAAAAGSSAADANAVRQLNELRRELARAKENLAHLIDEVVYTEQQTEAAEAKYKECSAQKDAIEMICQNLLGYTISLESSIVVPALSDLAATVPEDTLAARAALTNAASKLHDCTPRTAKLILSLKSPPATTRRKFEQRRDEILRASTADLNLEDAFVLCKLLMEAKEELRVLLDDTVERALAAAPQQVSDRIRKVKTDDRAELDRLRATLAEVQKERDILVQKCQQSASYESLQSQYHSEREMLQKRLKVAEDAAQKHNDERHNWTNKLDSLQQTLEQALQEKNMLSEEVARFRSGKLVPAAADVGNSATAPAAFNTSSTSGSNAFGFHSQSRANASSAAGGGAGQVSDSEVAHRMRLEMDNLIREHSSMVTRLEGQNAQLRMELAELRGAGNTVLVNEQAQQLQRTNDVLRKELSILQQRLLSSSPGAESLLDQKIHSFEMTISALNSELTLVEGKVAAIEKHYVEERNKLVASFDEERRRFQEEREECDALVLKMTNELEYLVRENNHLKSAAAMTPRT